MLGPGASGRRRLSSVASLLCLRRRVAVLHCLARKLRLGLHRAAIAALLRAKLLQLLQSVAASLLQLRRCAIGRLLLRRRQRRTAVSKLLHLHAVSRLLNRNRRVKARLLWRIITGLRRHWHRLLQLRLLLLLLHAVAAWLHAMCRLLQQTAAALLHHSLRRTVSALLQLCLPLLRLLRRLLHMLRRQLMLRLRRLEARLLLLRAVPSLRHRLPIVVATLLLQRQLLLRLLHPVSTRLLSAVAGLLHLHLRWCSVLRWRGSAIPALLCSGLSAITRLLLHALAGLMRGWRTMGQLLHVRLRLHAVAALLLGAVAAVLM